MTTLRGSIDKYFRKNNFFLNFLKQIEYPLGKPAGKKKPRRTFCFEVFCECYGMLISVENMQKQKVLYDTNILIGFFWNIFSAYWKGSVVLRLRWSLNVPDARLFSFLLVKKGCTGQQKIFIMGKFRRSENWKWSLLLLDHMILFKQTAMIVFRSLRLHNT